MLRGLRARLQYKIILPFLALALAVALLGYGISSYLLAKSQQQRFDDNLMDIARLANLAVVDRERANLQFLIEIVFAQKNPAVDAPAVDDAIRRNDDEGLYNALVPFFERGITLPMVNIDRMVAFNREGTSLVDLERNHPGKEVPDKSYRKNPQMPMGNLSIVQDTLRGIDDELIGDKYAQMMLWLPSTEYPEGRLYFATTAPVRYDGKVVSGVIAAFPLIISLMVFLCRPVRSDNSAWVIVRSCRISKSVSPGGETKSGRYSFWIVLAMCILHTNDFNIGYLFPVQTAICFSGYWIVCRDKQQPIGMIEIQRKCSCQIIRKPVNYRYYVSIPLFVIVSCCYYTPGVGINHSQLLAAKDELFGNLLSMITLQKP